MKRDRSPIAVVIFDPENVDRVSVLRASAVVFKDGVGRYYYVRYGQNRIRVLLDKRGTSFVLRLTRNNYLRLFQQ